MTTSTSTGSATKPTPRRQTSNETTEFRFDDDGSLVPLEAGSAPDGHGGFGQTREVDRNDGLDRSRDDSQHPGRSAGAEIDLRATDDADQIEHLVQLVSGDVATVIGANAYQPEGPMTTFFATGSSRGTIDSWSVRIASYRTNDIVSIQRSLPTPADLPQRRPNLVAV